MKLLKALLCSLLLALTCNHLLTAEVPSDRLAWFKLSPTRWVLYTTYLQEPMAMTEALGGPGADYSAAPDAAVQMMVAEWNAAAKGVLACPHLTRAESDSLCSMIMSWRSNADKALRARMLMKYDQANPPAIPRGK